MSAVRVAFQGELGAFSEEAVRRFFRDAADPLPRRDFRDVGRAVIAGEAVYGVLPVENSLAGGVGASYDVLGLDDIEVVGEVVVPIHHCVLGVEGASLPGLARVRSQPLALAECTMFFEAHPGIEAVAVYDTAGAAREVARLGDPATGALASRRAAERYGLGVLAADIEDRADNQTRFLVLARRAGPRPGLPSPGGERKTSILLETANEPGALVRALEPFAARGVNLCRLESRPAARPWTYRFILELDGEAAKPQIMHAVEEVWKRVKSLRILGSYTRAESREAPG